MYGLVCARILDCSCCDAAQRLSACRKMINLAAIANALLHRDGYLHNTPPTAAILPLLNKVETRRQYQKCRELAALILAAGQPKICSILAGSVQHDCFVRLS